jgi:hypothetical protein
MPVDPEKLAEAQWEDLVDLWAELSKRNDPRDDGMIYLLSVEMVHRQEMKRLFGSMKGDDNPA